MFAKKELPQDKTYCGSFRLFGLHEYEIWEINMRGYKDLTILYYVFGVIGIAVDAYLFVKDIVPFMAACLLLVFYLFLLLVWVSKVVQKRENKLIAIYNQCRFQEFIDKYVPVHEKDTEAGIAGFPALTLANAYMHLGNLEMALEMYAKGEPVAPGQRSLKIQIAPNQHITYITWQAVYHDNLACACLKCHNTAGAKMHIEESSQKLHQLEKMAGRIYECLGNSKESKKCKDFVRQYGGDSSYVKWAEDITP